jgi:hypothetical protein
MTDFSNEYVDLCRKLALPRVLEILDLIFFDGEVRPCPSRFIGYELDSLFLKPIECIWLPREGDWLEKFREERIPLTLRLMYDKHGAPFWFGIAPETKGLANHQEQGGDPELVLCRLYMAIRSSLAQEEAVSPETRDIGRILWNERGGEIDEIVLRDIDMVHVEQMDDDCWWIGITLQNGGYWAGNFYTRSKKRMTFTQQERDGFEWTNDDCHDDLAQEEGKP